MAQNSQTQSKWITASGSGNVYTKWDSNVIVKDEKGAMVQLNQRLKKEDGYEEQIGVNPKGEKVYYRVRDSSGTFLIYAEGESKRAERLAKAGGGGGKGKEEWYRIVDIHTTEDVSDAIYRITQERFSPWGKTFRDSTQVVNGKLVFGLVKREKVQPGDSQQNAGPTEAAPPV